MPDLMVSNQPAEISRSIWESRYRRLDQHGRPETDIAASWQRVAQAIAGAEASEPLRKQWQQAFYSILEDFRFLPGGRILAGAGTDLNVTLFNCFAMGEIGDDMDSIFTSLKEGALTMQAGGGIGYDFSTLRPQGAVASTSGTIASGPVSFMHIWNAMCATLLSTGARRGAMIATLRCDHPDIEKFIEAKHNSRNLEHFNLSVQVTDAFIAAVQADKSWPLVFPAGGPVVARRSARELWRSIMQAAYDTAEPGVLFVDRINQWNNLAYREVIATTNPCGEIPLPPYGACNLGAINLTRFVRHPFTPQAAWDMAGIRETAGVAARFLDNVITVSRFPLPAQAQQARGSRRIGLGITGLADALIMLGLHYDSEQARDAAAEAMGEICHAAYESSVSLAREKGSFPFFKAEDYCGSRFIQSLPAGLRADIRRSGIRNSHLTAIAPCGTVSLLAGNVSSGMEPVFAHVLTRRVLDKEGNYHMLTLDDYAAAQWRAVNKPSLPENFVTAQDLRPAAHLLMQAVLQQYVDNAISKTINVAEKTSFAEFEDIYLQAHRLGLKGCTVFRPNPVTGAILNPADDSQASVESVHCCNVEREGD